MIDNTDIIKICEDQGFKVDSIISVPNIKISRQLQFEQIHKSDLIEGSLEHRVHLVLEQVLKVRPNTIVHVNLKDCLTADLQKILPNEQ
jgi:hypothetical protein